MRISGFEDLAKAVQEATIQQPTASDIEIQVKRVFKKALAQVKSNGFRPTLTVGKSFLENYYKENGIAGMKEMLNKISLLMDQDSYDYLIDIGILKR